MLSILIAAAVTSSLDYAIWPQPASITGVSAARSLHPEFAIDVVHATGGLSAEGSTRLADAQGRYTRIAKGMSSIAATESESTGAAIEKLVIVVEDSSDYLGMDTRYNYTLDISADGKPHAVARAASIYGAMYAMESFVQLIELKTGQLLVSQVAIADAPQYNWRGLMIDAGRRFFPVPLVKNLMDSMAGAKLNVLHLHASDMCRFGVESKLFPNLTDALTGIHGGFYTQADVADLIAYGGSRGIRVVPEFDFPGHSRGYLPLETQGIEFCEPESDTRSQLYGDPGGSTYKVVHDLMKEMAGLFTDEVFNIGCDETALKERCTINSTFAVERKLFQAIATEFGKTPEGWEEALFDAGAATNNTIVNAWARHSASEITATGRRAVESKDSAFYFTGAAPGGPKGWSRSWYDISTNVPANQMKLLLGGEMSMWSDSYCYISQCGSSGGGAPVGHALFPPEQDEAFSKSIGGMIWPRGFVGAQAFYRYDAATKPDDPAFVAGIYKLSDSLAARGSYVCPTNCSCDQVSACGKPYHLKPAPPTPPPQQGSPVGLAACDPTTASSGQNFTLTTDGMLHVAGFPQFCVTGAHNVYPLTLGACVPNTWRHDSSASTLNHIPSSGCADADHTAHTIGVWACGDDQQNQHWSYDVQTGMVASLDVVDGIGGYCFTVNPPSGGGPDSAAVAAAAARDGPPVWSHEAY